MIKNVIIAVLGVLCVLLLGYSLIQQTEARRQQKVAVENYNLARQTEKEAHQQRVLAQANAEEAHRQKIIAEQNLLECIQKKKGKRR
jgi:cytochrome c-type biogenesis protein CcmH/NrfG